MKIDIRTPEKVDEIVFADKRTLWLTMTSIKPLAQGGVSFRTPGDTVNAWCLHDREEVDNLIRALEKSKELGWV